MEPVAALAHVICPIRDGQGRFGWELQNPDGSITIFTHDPGASIWKRMGARFLSWLPIEKEL